MFEDDLKKTNRQLNEPRTRTVKGPNSWQQAMRAKLYSDLLQALETDFALDSSEFSAEGGLTSASAVSHYVGRWKMLVEVIPHHVGRGAESGRYWFR